MTDEPAAVTDAEWAALRAIEARLDTSRQRREEIVERLGLEVEAVEMIRCGNCGARIRTGVRCWQCGNLTE